MQWLVDAGAVLGGYVLGSIPFGLLWVRWISGKDIRHVASGRTGGTNAARAAGIGAGLLTAVMDISKGAAAVWVAETLSPSQHLVHVLAPIAAIMGHNYSVFLIERRADNRVRLRGGAGGGPAAGGALGLWWPSALILLPAAVLVFFGIGYASVTTLSIAVITTIIFAVRFYMGLGPAVDILYGVLALLLLTWALRPNITALVQGKERFHGWRPWRKPTPLFPDHPQDPDPTPRPAARKPRTKSRGPAKSVRRLATRR